MAALGAGLATLALGLIGCQQVPSGPVPTAPATLTWSFTAPLAPERSHIEAAQSRNGHGEICVVSADPTMFDSLVVLVEQARSSVLLVDVTRPAGLSIDYDGDDRFEPVFGTIMDSTMFRIVSPDGEAVAFAGSHSVRAPDGEIWALPEADWLRAEPIALVAVLQAGCPDLHDEIRRRLDRD